VNKPDLRKAKLIPGNDTGTSPYGGGGIPCIPWGTIGVIDVANPWSFTMGNYWLGYWLVNGVAHHESVLTCHVEPYDGEISAEDMRLLEDKLIEGRKPIK